MRFEVGIFTSLAEQGRSGNGRSIMHYMAPRRSTRTQFLGCCILTEGLAAFSMCAAGMATSLGEIRNARPPYPGTGDKDADATLPGRRGLRLFRSSKGRCAKAYTSFRHAACTRWCESGPVSRFVSNSSMARRFGLQGPSRLQLLARLMDRNAGRAEPARGFIVGTTSGGDLRVARPSEHLRTRPHEDASFAPLPHGKVSPGAAAAKMTTSTAAQCPCFTSDRAISTHFCGW